MEKKLSKMPYAQAKVRDYRDIGCNMVILQSYATDVIIMKDGKLECTGLYSATTRKHISAFLSEYCPRYSYYDVKAIAGTGKTLKC